MENIDTPCRTIPDETMADLRWLAESPFSVALVDKPVLKLLLDAYAREAREWRPGDRRCEACDNGLNSGWDFCPFCGWRDEERAQGRGQ